MKDTSQIWDYPHTKSVRLARESGVNIADGDLYSSFCSYYDV